MARRNEEISALLENIAKLLALKREDPFRVRAYTEAAQSISAASEDIADLHQAGCLEEIPGVGTSIAAKVGEYLDTGCSSYYDELKSVVPVSATDLLDLPSIGPVRANLIAECLGITTLPALEHAAQEHKLRALPGIGAQLEEKIAREAYRPGRRMTRPPSGRGRP